MKNLSLRPSVSDFLFRFGIASFFLLNSLSAWLEPDEFLELLEKNPLASAIAAPHFWVNIIGINDGLVFLLILSGRWRKGVAIWAALWMLMVFYVTIPNGLFDLIEHAGIISLIIYYYFAFPQPSPEPQK